VQALTMGADGAVWASVDAGGVLRYDGQTWETFTTADGLVDNEIRAIAAAPDGSIWFTSLGGIGRYEP
jgi:ligand-binding sensor domain-containing protein